MGESIRLQQTISGLREKMSSDVAKKKSFFSLGEETDPEPYRGQFEC
jgi:hypothetical protein